MGRESLKALCRYVFPLVTLWLTSFSFGKQALADGAQLQSLNSYPMDKVFSVNEHADIEKGFQSLQSVFTQAADNSTTGQQALIVILGGWNSCNWAENTVNIFTQTNHFIKTQATRGHNYRLVAACYGKFSSTIYFSLSSHDDRVYTGKIPNLVNAINFEAGLVQDRRVYILGHSYGGWLAMQSSLRLNADLQLQGLVTLDPISRIKCTAASFSRAYLRSIFTVAPEPGCTESPSDILPVQYAQLSQRYGWWKNIFQTDTVFLHASAITQADNIHLDYDIDGVLDIFSPHVDIVGDTRSWHQFAPLMAEFL